MNLQPLEDRIVVKPIEEKQEGMIVIPEIAKERSTFGEVLAVGPGKCCEHGMIHPVSIIEGDKVLFGKYSGTEIEVNGEQVFIMRQSDVLAIVK